MLAWFRKRREAERRAAERVERLIRGHGAEAAKHRLRSGADRTSSTARRRRRLLVVAVRNRSHFGRKPTASATGLRIWRAGGAGCFQGHQEPSASCSIVKIGEENPETGRAKRPSLAEDEA